MNKQQLKRVLNIKDFLFLRSILASVSFSRWETRQPYHVMRERRQKSSIILHPSRDVNHGIRQGLLNEIVPIHHFNVANSVTYPFDPSWELAGPSLGWADPSLEWADPSCCPGSETCSAFRAVGQAFQPGFPSSCLLISNRKKSGCD